LPDAGEFGELAQLLYDQASLAEGTQLANPPEYVQRLNRLLVRLPRPAAGSWTALARHPPSHRAPVTGPRGPPEPPVRKQGPAGGPGHPPPAAFPVRLHS